jgi:predicted GTPase
MSIVDTPGTNAIVREHEALTSQFVPRSDLVLFITSADRPFTESEKIFLQHISILILLIIICHSSKNHPKFSNYFIFR